MKYKLLPNSFHDRFDTLKKDYNDTDADVFLSGAQKYKAMDKKEKAKIEKNKSSLKKNKSNPNEASTSTTSRSSKSNNSKYRKRKVSFP